MISGLVVFGRKAGMASRPAFWVIAKTVALTPILLASPEVYAQQSVDPVLQQNLDQILCSNEIYRNATPDCERFASPQQKAANAARKAADAAFQAGSEAMKSGQWDEVIANMTKVAETDPSNENAYFALYSLGMAYRAKRDFAHAISFFDKAIANDSSIAMAFERRGDTYSDLGNAKAALADFDRAITLEPNRASAYSARGRQKLMGKDQEGALADLDRAIVLNPKEVRAFYGRALVHANAANYDLALADLAKAIEIDHRFSPAFTELGIIYLRLGKRDQARDALSTALNLNPNNKSAREALDALAKN